MSSRFALLPDDVEEASWKKVKAKKESENSTAVANKSKKSKKSKKKNNNDQVTKDLQALAFGLKKPPTSSTQNSRQNGQNSTNSAQFEAWRSKDVQIVDEAFENDLQAAILASKIDHSREQIQREIDTEVRSKKSGKTTLSLGDFKKLSVKEVENINNINASVQQKLVADHGGDSQHFFDNVEKEAKRAINREQILSSIKERSWIPDEALVKQYRSVLESKDEEIARLTEEKEHLSSTLEKTKKRFKQFRDLLNQCESREMVEVVVENSKLRKLYEELQEDAGQLREENEKLKTKVAEHEKKSKH